MKHYLAEALLWLASRVGRLGFKLRGADVTDMCCYLSLVLEPEKASGAMDRAIDAALARIGDVRLRNDRWQMQQDERINTVPNKDTN